MRWKNDVVDFNSHTREGVTIQAIISKCFWLFQLTHPWGCDDMDYLDIPTLIMHFNSHTREGVTNVMDMYKEEGKISTHTPVRVWLCEINYSMTRYNISTHTPVRVWLLAACQYPLWACISTHTPVRVWLESIQQNQNNNWFQLTHPWGCDTMVKLLISIWTISTHTPVRVWRHALTGSNTTIISTHTPVRVWLAWIWKRVLSMPNFNSHTREGVTILKYM